MHNKTINTTNAINNLNLIIKKISELIDISLSDFLYLNNIIKEFNNKTIINNSRYRQLTEQITNNNYISKAESIINILRQQKRDYYHFSIEINKLINLLNEILHNSEKLLYIFRSIYNDICTIKILLIDYNLRTNKNNLTNRVYKNTNILLDTINEVINILNIRKNLLRNSLKNLERTNDNKNKIEIKEKFNHICFSLYVIIKANHKIKKIRKNFEEKSNKINETINNTIIQLQYQDIVRQKFEHVSIINKQIIQKIQELSDNTNSEKYLENISDIIYLEAAQIMHANNVYINALKNIIKNIWQINDINESLNNDYKKINRYLEFFSINNINNLRKTIIKANTVILNNIKNYENTINTFNQNNSIFKERINIIYKNIKTYYSIIKEINNSTDKTEINNEKSILFEINSIFNNILNLLKEVTEISEKEENNNYFQLIIEGGLLSRNPNIDNIIKNTTELKLLFFDLLIIFKEFNSKITEFTLDHIENNRISLEGIKYYENFEKEIKNIFNKLVELAKLFKDNNLSSEETFSSKRKKLENIRKIYTVKSEYLIHDDFTKLLDSYENNTDENILSIIEKNKINDLEGDVELF